MARAIKKERSTALYEHILELKTLDECCRFFEDLCAVTELRSMEQRFDVAKMLHGGKVYTAILNETGASSATVSRVNRMLNFGTGAITEVMDRVDAKKEDPEGAQ
jgi:TrpR-related protein YerC/YecD